MMTTLASGGTSPFVVAGSAVAVIERRTVPGEAAADGLAEVETILAGMRRDDPSVQAAAAMSLSREAWEHDAASPAGSALAGMLGAALSGRRGSVSKQVAVPYWMESAL
jgi:acetylornithine deacetylase/succinyl-diaminopimelate desuccinylase-like protein